MGLVRGFALLGIGATVEMGAAVAKAEIVDGFSGGD